jgi:hypothetical protein
MNPIITGKKSPKRLMNPKPSKSIPITGHFTKTAKIPKKKQIVPLILSLLLKNPMVLVQPIIRNNPQINNIYVFLYKKSCTFPMAKSPPSKNNKIPKTINKTPKAVSPTPISKKEELNKF